MTNSKHLNYSPKDITTCLGTKNIELATNKIVLCSIIRAELILHQGILNYFDNAENAFISAYRNHPNNDAEFEIIVEYFTAPDLNGKTLVL